jgi:GTPase SAR1 family protein
MVMRIWDAAGQEQFRTVTMRYLCNHAVIIVAAGALIVCDVSNKKSFKQAEEWLIAIQERATLKLKLGRLGRRLTLQEQLERRG